MNLTSKSFFHLSLPSSVVVDRKHVKHLPRRPAKEGYGKSRTRRFQVLTEPVFIAVGPDLLNIVLVVLSVQFNGDEGLWVQRRSLGQAH